MVPDEYAIKQALVIGVIIPFLSSVLPIKDALSKSLVDALNTDRSKLTGVEVTLTEKGERNFSTALISGSLTVIFGTVVYLFLPLGLLK